MYLKSLTVKGFKSFANKTILSFEPGTTVIVGPNGSGKSNLVDAFLWVLGEQNPRSLRSSKMEDVIFSGSFGKKPLGVAEVSLCFDNSHHIFPIEYADVTITRRIFRSGESEYSLNGSSCRLIDVQELLLNTGTGREMYSVVGQGRLEAILSSRPEERRYLIEEAAGLAKYKRRKEKALRKLSSCERNLTRGKDILFEVRRQLRPLYEQARLAQKHRDLVEKIKGLEIELTLRELKDLEKRWQEFEKQKKTVDVRANDVAEKTKKGQNEIAKLEAKLEESRKRRDALKEQRYALATGHERLKGLISVLQEKESSIQFEVGRLEQAEEDALKEHERQEKFPGTIGFVKDFISVPDKYKVAVESLLKDDLLSLVAKDLETARQAVKKANEDKESWSSFLISGSKKAKPGVQSPKNAKPILDLIEAKDEIRSTLSYILRNVFVVETPNEAFKLAADEKWQDALFVTLAGDVVSSFRVSRTRAGKVLSESPAKKEDKERLTLYQQRLEGVTVLSELLLRLSNSFEKLEAKVHQSIEIEHIDQEGVTEDLTFKRAEIAELEKELSQFERESHAEDIYKAQLEPEITALKDRLKQDFRISQKEAEKKYLSSQPKEAVLRNLSDLRREIEILGPINPIAVEEYKEVEERKEHLESQINDLKKSQRMLDKVIKMMDDKMAEKFTEVFDRTNQAFQEFFAYLFPEGQAKLLLTNPDDILNTGIEIEAQPQGKRLKKLSLLSGGESAMTAIALIFALFKTNPAPFYILDEVDVALDDVNLQRFVSLLERFRDSTQFLVVTHQRRTMEMADILYGVTMQSDGVSKLISQRLKEASS